MTNAIPASQLVSVQPGVMGTGGNPLSLNAVFLTNNPAVPIGTVRQFNDPVSVGTFFGNASIEAAMAADYFLGFDNSTTKPSALYFAQYNTASVGAYLRSGSVSSLTLAQLQAFSGTLIVVVDGVTKTSGTINLAAATSFSNAATLISAGFSGGVPVCTYDSQRAAFILTSGTTGASSTIGYCAGTLATNLKFTQATSATISPGAIAATPSGAMTTVAAVIQNWATFMTLWEPNTTDCINFAIWSNAQNQRFLYVGWDTDPNAAVSADTTNFGYLVDQADYNGVCPVYMTAANAAANGPTVAAFICGAIGSVNFSQVNGRVTFAYKSQAGIIADVVDAQTAVNLTANGYNFYGAYATANDQFTFLQPGQVAGVWTWMDPYVNQIFLNSQFQLALMELEIGALSIPYNQQGYGMIRAACMDPIQQGLLFGAIRPGVNLSNLQKAQLNQAAGVDIATTIEQQGWYLQILDATAQIRGLRGAPPMTFWYTDAGSIQRITLASIDVE